MKNFLKSFSKKFKIIGFYIQKTWIFIYDFFRKIPKAFKLMGLVEKTVLTVLAIAAAVLLVVKGSNIYQDNTKIQPVIGGSLKIGLNQEPKNFNPLFAQTDADKAVINMVFSPLVKIQPDGQIDKVLIEKYKASEDFKEHTVWLKKDLKWHDSKPVTVEDLVYTFSIIKSPEYSGIYKGVFNNVDFQETEDNGFKFILNAPYKNFLSALDISILPSHLLSEKPLAELSSDGFSINPIGNGPYTIKKSTLEDNNNKVILEVFEDSILKPKVEKIELRFYNGLNNMVYDFEKNRLDALLDIPTENKNLIENQNFNVVENKLMQYNVLHFNTENQRLSNKNLRKAISLSVSKKQIIEEAFNDQAVVNNSVITEGSYAYKKFEDFFNQDEAKTIVLNQGYSLNGQYFQQDGKDLEFNLITLEVPEYKKTAEIIQENLKKVGIKVNIDFVTTSELQAEIIPGRKFDLLLIGETLGDDFDLYPYWHSSQATKEGLNLSNFKNDDADNVLDELRNISTVAERKNLYFKLQDIINEEAPAIFLNQPVNRFLISKEVKNVKPALISEKSDFFFNSHFWYIKLGRGKK